MRRLPQLRFNLAEHALRQLLLRWFHLGVVYQLEDQGAYRSLEPPTDAEVLAILDKLIVEFAKGVSRVFLREGSEALLTEVEPEVGVVTFDLELNRLCIFIVSFFIIFFLPILLRHIVSLLNVCESYDFRCFRFAKAFTGLCLIFLSHLVNTL